MTLDTRPTQLLPALRASIADGAIEFVNPAGTAILGYDDAPELLGRPSQCTIHAHRRDGSPYPEDERPLLRPRATGQAVQVDDHRFIRRDGSMVPVAYSSAPFATPGGRRLPRRDDAPEGRVAAAAGGGRAAVRRLDPSCSRPPGRCI